MAELFSASDLSKYKLFNKFKSIVSYPRNMASQENVDELEFLDSTIESSDKTDGVSASVIPYEKDWETSTKYVMKKTGLLQYQPTVQRIRGREKVSSSWGRPVNLGKSSAHIKDGIPALLTFEAEDASCIKTINDKVIHNFDQALSKISGEGCLDILKYSELQILVKLKGPDTYEEFGKCFLDGKITEISGFKLVEVKVVSVVSPYPCYVELECSALDGSKLQAELSSLFVSYCSRFSCISINETCHKDDARSTSPIDSTGDTVPAITMMMMFTSKAQRNAQKFIQEINMAKNEWKERSLPKECSESGEVFFEYSNIPGMSISIKQGSPFPGIKILLFVNIANFDEMAQFYRLITGKSPLVEDKIQEGIRYRTYSLSRKLELQLVSHPKIKPRHSRNVNLCFTGSDISKIVSDIPGEILNLGEKQWQVTDPDGNSVKLFSLIP